ncbi:MAG TPA: HAMP domain-containing sensor histidine kinase [Planctomycetota bacterium]
MGLRRRLLLSFLALFAAVFAAIALVSTVLVGRAVEARLREQAVNLGRLVDGLDRPVLVNYLSVLRDLHKADGLRVGELVDGQIRDGPSVFRVPTRHGELVLAHAPDVLSKEKAAVVQPLAMVAVAGLALVAGLAVLTAQAVARPIEQLAAAARSLPKGDVAPVGGGPELDHLVEAMNRMLAEVRRSERLGVMGQMAAGVAHEIRNPLSSMKMTVQMLRESAADRDPFDLLLREIERLELTAAELSGASQPLRKEPARVEAVVEEVLALMARRLEHLGVKVEKRFAPVEAAIDVDRFKRCVMNLVLNGAQAMPAGGRLVVGVEGSRFWVTDEGNGVPADLGDTIFDPFVTTKRDGVGLGLALTKRIVEDHGGAIGFDRGPGKGTTFWIELPHG